jgi:RHS repeat-associated protein
VTRRPPCLFSEASGRPSIFTGKIRDTETGNDYFGARYYTGSVSRFMSPDWSAKAEPVPYSKLDDPQTLNLYAYVGNNPLSRVDPNGHYECNGTECKQVHDALQLVSDAVNNKKNGLTNNQRSNLKKVLDFYGKENTKNGVTVNTGVSGIGLGKTGTEKGQTTISLNLSLLDGGQNGSTPTTEKAAEVVHEGWHGGQQRKGGMLTPGSDDDKQYHREQEAYTVQSGVNQSQGTTSAWGVWRPDVGFNQNAVNGAAADSTRLWNNNPNWRSPDERSPDE